MSVLPPSIPFMRVETRRRGPQACLSAFAHGLHLVGAAGRALGVDPGMPRVPAFGRTLYHLNVFNRVGAGRADLAKRESASIERKAGTSIRALAASGELPFWRSAYAQFMKHLLTARFSAVLLDYDGTLHDGTDRGRPPSPAVAAQLTRLTAGGVHIGIATGRGGSVRDALRGCLPSEMWSQVTVGYRNGTEVGLLGDDSVPGESEDPGEGLVAALAAIQSKNFLRAWVRKLRPRPGQITVYPAPSVSVERLWEAILQVVLDSAASGTQVLRSSHSVDIIAAGISMKRAPGGKSW